MAELEKLLKKDSSVKVHCGSGEHCIYVQPNPYEYDEGVKFIGNVYNWLCKGSYPGLRVIDCFQRYDLHSLKICVNSDNKRESYRELIDCIEDEHHRSRPYED